MPETESLELHVDKFVLKVPKDLWYAGYDTWVKVTDSTATVGISDFLQTKLGDILYFTPEQKTEFQQDDVLGNLESLKANVEIIMPATGSLIAFNIDLDTHPELLSQDPYGKGWIAKIELTDWENDQLMLLPPEKYFAVLQEKARDALTR